MHLTAFGNGIAFATDETSSGGNQLWISDGTEVGTVVVKDFSGLGSPRELVKNGGILYFVAHDGPGDEIWKSDGTFDGTSLVIDRNADNLPIDPARLTVSGGNLFFNAKSISPFTGEELWISDGTSEGTVLLKDTYPGSYAGNPDQLTDVNGLLFFTLNFEQMLWLSDGTNEGTVRVNLPVSGGLRRFGSLLNNDGILYFSVIDTLEGESIWRSDGTDIGTFKLENLSPSTENSTISQFRIINELLFFQADDGESGSELWMSDGTSDGTVLLDDFVPGSPGSYAIGGGQSDDGLFYFTSEGPGGPWTLRTGVNYSSNDPFLYQPDLLAGRSPIGLIGGNVYSDNPFNSPQTVHAKGTTRRKKNYRAYFQIENDGIVEDSLGLISAITRIRPFRYSLLRLGEEGYENISAAASVGTFEIAVAPGDASKIICTISSPGKRKLQKLRGRDRKKRIYFIVQSRIADSKSDRGSFFLKVKKKGRR